MSVLNMKPVKNLNNLLNAVGKIAQTKHALPKKRFKLMNEGQAMCFLLYSGSCILSRDEDALVISTATAPNIFGISTMHNSEMNMTIEALTDIEFVRIPQDQFFDYVEEIKAWKDVSYVQMYLTSMLYEHFRKNTGLSSYKIVANLLNALTHEEFEVRAMTPAVTYIKERTHLSRSGIMKILSDLKSGGYIVLSRGILIKINKLPEEY